MTPGHQHLVADRHGNGRESNRRGRHHANGEGQAARLAAAAAVHEVRPFRRRRYWRVHAPSRRNTTIAQPVYAKGCLDLRSNTGIEEPNPPGPPTTVSVNVGRLNVGGGGHVGTTARPINWLGTGLGGCNGGACPNGADVHAETYASSVSISLPTVDKAWTFCTCKANWSAPTCDPSGRSRSTTTPQARIDNSLGTTNLTASEVRLHGEGRLGNEVGRLAWNSQPRVERDTPKSLLVHRGGLRRRHWNRHRARALYGRYRNDLRQRRHGPQERLDLRSRKRFRREHVRPHVGTGQRRQGDVACHAEGSPATRGLRVGHRFCGRLGPHRVGGGGALDRGIDGNDGIRHGGPCIVDNGYAIDRWRRHQGLHQRSGRSAHRGTLARSESTSEYKYAGTSLAELVTLRLMA